MKMLIGCEESQAVCNAFRKKGHEAYSCDILDTSGDYPEYHIKGDFLQVVKATKYDLVISFPPCTDLTVSGARHFEKKRLNGSQEKAIMFFFEVWKVSDCTENPVGIMNGGGYIKKWFPVLYKEMLDYGFPFKESQIINPFDFGDNEAKKTCLWLKRKLKQLIATHSKQKNLFMNVTYPEDEKYICSVCGNIFSSELGKYGCCLKPARIYRDNITKSGRNKLTPSPDRAKIRSKTYPGIAEAMANQWG